MTETPDRAERFASWKLEADAGVYDLAGFWPNHAPDDPRFTWWNWFDQSLSATAAAEAVVDILTDDWVVQYVHAAQP